MSSTRYVVLSVAALVLASWSPTAGSQVGHLQERLLDDLTSSRADFGWFVVNDTVMGGRSDGSVTRAPSGLRFTGLTNTNGGGFSSIRTRDMALDLSRHDGIRLRVQADGRRYTWRLTTDARWRGRQISYWADFDTQAGGWRDIDIPFALFRPTYRGWDLAGPALDAARISGMGLMIYDGKDGGFELQLSRIAAYGLPIAETAP